MQLSLFSIVLHFILSLCKRPVFLKHFVFLPWFLSICSTLKKQAPCGLLCALYRKAREKIQSFHFLGIHLLRSYEIERIQTKHIVCFAADHYNKGIKTMKLWKTTKGAADYETHPYPTRQKDRCRPFAFPSSPPFLHAHRMKRRQIKTIVPGAYRSTFSTNRYTYSGACDGTKDFLSIFEEQIGDVRELYPYTLEMQNVFQTEEAKALNV